MGKRDTKSTHFGHGMVLGREMNFQQPVLPANSVVARCDPRRPNRACPSQVTLRAVPGHQHWCRQRTVIDRRGLAGENARDIQVQIVAYPQECFVSNDSGVKIGVGVVFND